MGRIEKDLQMKSQIEEMKGEVVKEIRKTDTRGSKLTCSLLFLAGLVGFIGWVLWSVAATGLVGIAGMTSLAYDEPAPVRVVLPGVPLETVIQETAQTTLTRRLQQGGGTLTDTSITLELDESSFTSTLQSAMEESGETFFDTSRVQAAVRENGIFEVFLPLANNKQDTALVADLAIDLKDNLLNVQVKRVRLGSYIFPRMLTDFFAETFVKPQLPSLNASFGSYAKVRALRYAEGTLTIDGSVEVTLTH